MKHYTDISINYFSAEALDNHLTALQRDHEHKAQIEERRIRDDAVREEAQRREKSLQEEKLRQQKIKAEAEVRLLSIFSFILLISVLFLCMCILFAEI